MKTRLLPPEEWSRLDGTEAAMLVPMLNRERDMVIAIEDGKELIGCVPVFWALHADCVWIHPDHRKKAGVARALWAALGSVAQQNGRAIGIMATQPVMKQFLERMGAQLVQGDQYVWASKQDSPH